MLTMNGYYNITVFLNICIQNYVTIFARDNKMCSIYSCLAVLKHLNFFSVCGSLVMHVCPPQGYAKGSINPVGIPHAGLIYLYAYLSVYGNLA